MANRNVQGDIQDALYFTFVGGINTEAGPFHTERDDALDMKNMMIERDASIRRRPAIVYEDPENPVLFSQANFGHGEDDDLPVYAFDWRYPKNDDPMLVLQLGREVRTAYNTEEEVTHRFGFVALGHEDRFHPISVSPTNDGKILLAHKSIDPVLIEPSGVGISYKTLHLKERDLDGANPPPVLTRRPTSLSDEHRYNLLNQGWTTGLIDEFFVEHSVYPSLADIWHFGKAEDGGIDKFNPEQVVEMDFGNNQAPRGRFIRSVFDHEQIPFVDQEFDILDVTTNDVGVTDFEIVVTIDDPDDIHEFSAGSRITIAGTESFIVSTDFATPIPIDQTWNIHDVVGDDLYLDNPYSRPWDESTSVEGDPTSGTVSKSVDVPHAKSTDNRPSLVKFFQGRAFYAGIDADHLRNRIYFSQIADQPNDFEKCYQDADPTSEVINELTDADGGFITLPESGEILSMEVMNRSLMIFTKNGVWSVGPGEQGFFSPVSYTVRKVTGDPVVSRWTTTVRGVPLFIGYEGIYVITVSEETGGEHAQSITDEKIRSLFAEIPDSVKSEMFPVYDEIKGKVWVAYGTEERPTLRHKFLVYNVNFNSWEYHETLVGKETEGLGVPFRAEGQNLDSGNIKFVLRNMDDPEELYVARFDQKEEEGYPSKFIDFKGVDGWEQEAKAYVKTFHDTVEDPRVRKRAPIVHCYFERTENGADEEGNLWNPSGCFMNARFDWHESNKGNKQSPTQQVYRLPRNFILDGDGGFDMGDTVVVTRNKVRGSGRAVQFVFEAEKEKNMKLYGWTVRYRRNARV